MELNTTDYLIKYAQRDILNQLLLHLNTMGDNNRIQYDLALSDVEVYIIENLLKNL